MKRTTRLFAYPETRALEDAAYANDTSPTRIFAILLPVWRVDVKATITEGEPYGLVDRFLARGIAEADLDTPDALASFFALDPTLVDRALRFLAGIGHVTSAGGRVTLTTLGARSVRDEVRYVTQRHDRRTLYFDAYGSRPLPRLRDGAVTFLRADEIADLPSDGPRFAVLVNHRAFRTEAFAALERHSERHPDAALVRVEHPEVLSEELVYLPLYVVRAATGDTGVRYLAYSQAGAEASPQLSEICQRTADIVSVLETEEVDGRAGLDENRARDWIRAKGLESGRLFRLPSGGWRLIVPASSFGADGPLTIRTLGSFVALGSGFFQVWCADRRARQRALAERVGAIVGSRSRADREELDELIGQIARQLELGQLDAEGLRPIAVDVGRKALADQLARLD